MRSTNEKVFKTSDTVESKQSFKEGRASRFILICTCSGILVIYVGLKKCIALRDLTKDER